MRKMPRTSEKGTNRHADPDYAPTVEIFDGLSHEEIHAGVALLNPVVLAAGQQAWQGSSTGLASAVEQAHTEIRSVIADGWRGGAAQTAADAVRAFERTGQQLADVMAAVAQRLGQAGDAAEALRGAVPAPSDAEPDLPAALLDPTQATDNATAQKTAEGARQDVVQAMDSIYTKAFIPTGSGVPAFPDEIPTAAAEMPSAVPVGQVPAATGFVNGTETLTAQMVSPSVSTTVTPTASTETTTVPGSTAPATTTTPAVTPVSAVDTAPTAPKTVAATVDSSASGTTTPATSTTAPDRIPRTGTATVTAAAAPVVAPTFPGTGGANPADDERKRDDRRRDTSSDAIAGAGAGMMGGLMGGALAAADTPRQGASPAARAAQQPLDEDDDLHFIDDELTFLEPADDGGELIGEMDPTTPPVVGEWTELE